MVSKEQAYEIVKSKLGSLHDYEIEVFDGANHRAGIYGDFDWDNLWYARISEISNEPNLESSRLVLIDKDTGVVVFNGYAADEG